MFGARRRSVPGDDAAPGKAADKISQDGISTCQFSVLKIVQTLRFHLTEYGVGANGLPAIESSKDRPLTVVTLLCRLPVIAVVELPSR
jgi:hypothetical protein